jgi:hypothetical protein
MSGRRFLPGALVVRCAPGLEFEGIHAHRDVRTRVAEAATSLDGGPLDRVIRRRSGALRASRAFAAAETATRPGQRHLGFGPLEHEIGLSRTFRLELDPSVSVDALAADLAAVDGVEMATPSFLCETPFAVPRPAVAGRGDDMPWAMIGAARALEEEPGDSALIIGFVDSGASPQHAELLGRLRPGLNTVSAAELSTGVELLSHVRARGQDTADDEGHGTAVAGILGANGLGIPRGLAGAAELLPIRALCGARVAGEAHATALGSLADIDSGVKTAIDLGARVLNLSFGTPESTLDPSDPVPHVQVVRYASARGCVLVSASGNSGADERYFPAALPGVIAVGSVGDDRRRSAFSTGGSHVALSAPGEQLRVAALIGYARLSGTSFASPLVAAACALMLARGLRRSTALSGEMVRDLLRRSAAPFAPGDGATTTSSCGAGILDIPAALRAVDEACRTEAA